jgi:hypothetical protein
MNIDYNTSLAGEYTIYDENMNVLSETKNLITDWGMRRFVGDRLTGAPHPEDTDLSQQAFVNNMRFIMLGIGGSYGTETYSNFSLVSAIPATDYTEYNVQATTGTTLSTDSASGDMLIIFTRLTRFEMASAFDSVMAPTSSYEIKEIGCSWSQTCSANNRFGIFSRATLPSPITVRPRNKIYAKYKLTIRTDANQVKGSMARLNGTGAVNLPANRTNVRELPLFTLKTDGTSAGIINNNLGDNYNYSLPLFEDAGTNNLTYVDVADNTAGDVVFGPSAQKLWWLQFYTSNWATTNTIDRGSDPATRYDTFVSTTSSNLNPVYNLTVLFNAINNVGANTYDGVIAQNLKPFTTNVTGRKSHDSVTVTTVNSNTWKRTIRFLFTPAELMQNITVFNLYRANLGDWDLTHANFSGYWWTHYDNRYINIDTTAPHTFGIVTALSAEYNPNPSLYDGFEYNFTFSRN